ncbi:arylamine N-acetyltransferase 2 [Microdochium bolleyi]|uniref:Arylamine N-acetyltransferase 2 n=1 Tax=Microdochium bolleyi TaxID=196109 RepID=A0A136IWZ8_9PEZI|nr:arylamine N-acetyltransferase 2 [Microdochium bolleyi]
MASLTPPTSALSQDQLEAYLAHIGLPADPGADPKPAAHRKLNLPFLTQLLEHQICAVPYENLGMHYSRDKVISLDVQNLFDKCVGNGGGSQSRGRGGYCLESTLLFNHVLRALGFYAWIVGARARPRVNGVPQGDYTGWLHTVNIVKFPDGSRYMVDVAYGGDLSTKPLLLDPSPEGTISHNSIGTQQVRLVRGPIPGLLSGEKLWRYEYRNNSPGQDNQWNACFCFAEAEFLPQDLEVMNVYTSRDPRCFLAASVLVVRFLRNAETGGIYGKRMLVNAEVKENLDGKTAVVRTCRTEAERVAALRELLGIELTEEEVQGIKGTAVELSG